MHILGVAKIKNPIRKFFKNENKESTLSLSEINNFFKSRDGSYMGASTSEITYYTCLKKLSESLGKLPIRLVGSDQSVITNHESIYYLQTSPNRVQIPAQFWTSLELCRNHYGNGYAFVARDARGHMSGLYALDPRRVAIWVDDSGKFPDVAYWYQYALPRTGGTMWIHPDDMIHVKSWVQDDTGLAGKSVREILRDYMAGAKASQKFLNDLYQNGLMSNVVIKYMGDLSKATKQKIIEEAEFLSGPGKGRVLPIPPTWDVQPLDLKLTDAQFLEISKYSALRIAAAFGIMPNHLNDYEKSSYANSAMQNLTFYVDTLLYNLSTYEQELTRKLLNRTQINAGWHYSYDISVILRGDPTQQSEVVQNLVQSSVYTINDARRVSGLPPIPDGDTTLVASGMLPLDKLKGGEDDEKQIHK